MKYARLIPAAALLISGAAAGCSSYNEPSAPTHISAASLHLKGGANSEPPFIDNGLSLTSNGALAGLGNEDLVVTLSPTANVTANCTNHGGNQPPGQNPAPITVTGSQSIPASEIKNGNVSFSVTTNGPTTPIPGAPDCPNPNWSENIQDLAVTSATITVEQPAGTLVLTVSCTFKIGRASCRERV